MMFHILPGSMLYPSPNGGRNDPYSMYDTTMGGNWYKADEPWGAYLQTEGNPAVTIHPYESDPSSGSFNPQAHTTWVPVDWNSWPNCEFPDAPFPRRVPP